MSLRRRQAWAGLGLLVLVSAPPLRGLFESRMTLHMLLQIPALALAGYLLAASLPVAARRWLQRCNAHGLSGWTYASLALAFWMLPRALDEAVESPAVAGAKLLVVLAAGLAIRLSLQASALVVQLFFLGNWAWMTATAGLLYVETPLRLCNAYLLDDQALTGYGLIVQALAVPMLWWRLHGKALGASAAR
jgi:hypothetical protein